MSSGGETVYEKNPDKKMLTASTAKLMTAIVAIETLDLDSTVEISADCCGIEGSSMYLKPGEKLSVKELLEGLLLVSGNDAAAVLACSAAGNQENFAELMNEKARELGMDSSFFVNPHGLDAEGQYSTAADMAKLMAYCMQNDSFAEISGLRSCFVGERCLVNHNKLLDMCRGCIGGKTGYTKAAGRCLVSCCERGSTRFICATFSAPDDWNDHIKLYDWAFENYCCRDAAENLSFRVPVVSGKDRYVTVVPEGPLMIFSAKNEAAEIKAELPQFVFAPVEEGLTAGRISAIINGKTAGECALVYAEDVPAATLKNLMPNGA